MIESNRDATEFTLSHLVHLHHFDQVDYAAAWRWQEATAAAVREGGSEALALLQHPPTYTQGRHPRYEHLIASREELAARGAALVESDRGGDITFHGPGQILGYPILNLRARRLGPVDYVRRLEAVLIETLGHFGLPGRRLAGRPGVWVGDAKIAALGVRVQGGVSTHGFALNAETDLAWFDAIVPCGINDAGVTSMARELGYSPGIAAVETAIAGAFAGHFDAVLTPEAPPFVDLAPVEQPDRDAQRLQEVAAHGR
jgi:lipoyl(octanoyl) transferase